MNRPHPRWILVLVCGAQFMFILDLSIATLALPSIRADLGLSDSQLQWVVVSYGLTLGGFLLLGGRTADLVGRRNVLIVGLAVFSLASLSAGLAGSFTALVASRAVQGLGAAFASPAALSILTRTFAEGAERNRALGIFGAVAAGAASIGLVLGGALTTGPGWEWVFLMNVPVGAVLIGFTLTNIPAMPPDSRGAADVPGAVAVTAGLMAIVYAISESVERGWTSQATIGFASVGLALILLFVLVERRARSPILPMTVFRQRSLTIAVVIAALVFASFLGFNLQLTLLIQQELGYSAIEAGVAWLATSIAAVFVAMVVAARTVTCFGAARTLVAGQACSVAGWLWFSRTPVDAAYAIDLFPGLVLIGVGIGCSAMAVQVAAFIGVDRSIAGVAGGVVESCRELGGALGTAIIATVALTRSRSADATDAVPGAEAGAFVEGFRRGALVATMFSVAAAVAAGFALRRAERQVAVDDSFDRLAIEPAEMPLVSSAKSWRGCYAFGARVSPDQG